MIHENTGLTLSFLMNDIEDAIKKLLWQQLQNENINAELRFW